jgi:hypothetical protein
MDSRDAAIAAVRDRLTRAVAEQDLSGVLTEEALGDAEELRARADSATDLDAAYVLGMFYWFRYLALPEGASQDDLTAAARLLAPVFRAKPEAVPEPLRRFYQQTYGHTESTDLYPGAREEEQAIELFSAYQRTGELPLLTEAVELFRAIAAATPAGHPDRAAVLSNLGGALRELSERTGDTAVLAEAVQADRDALAATPAGHPNRAVILSNLGNALRELSERTGDSAVLAEAVKAGREVVAATPAGHPNRAAILSNLGAALQALSERTGDTAVLAEAVQAGRDAVAVTPTGHPDRAGRLHNLCITLRVLFGQTGDTAVLAEAVQAGRDAVAATPTGHPDRAGCLNSLGAALQALFERTGDSAVLAEAVQAGRDAVAATLTGDPDHAKRLNNLGITLLALFERTGHSAVLAEAVQAGRDAVGAAPTGHPDRAVFLNNLGAALQALAEHTGETSPLAEAGECFTQAAETASAPATVRIRAYRAVAGLPERAGGSPQKALAAMEAAVGLLPQVAPRGLVWDDREHSLGELASLAGAAAAAAVTAGRPGRAVELLEQTRGVLVADTLDARSSDLTRLRGHPSGLAEEFDELRARIDALDHPRAYDSQSADPEGDEPDLAKARRDAHATWDDLIARIRAIDGFEDFVRARVSISLPPTPSAVRSSSPIPASHAATRSSLPTTLAPQSASWP